MRDLLQLEAGMVHAVRATLSGGGQANRHPAACLVCHAEDAPRSYTTTARQTAVLAT